MNEETIKRMERFLRKMAITYGSHPHENAYDEARAIVTEIDGNADAAIMREVLVETYGPCRNSEGKLLFGDGPSRVAAILDGNNDFWEAKFALACIAKGRELERQSKAETQEPPSVGISDKWEHIYLDQNGVVRAFDPTKNVLKV